MPHPVEIPESSDIQVPIVEESAWGNNELKEPVKVEYDEKVPSEPIECTIDDSLQKQDNVHVGTTLKNLNFR